MSLSDNNEERQRLREEILRELKEEEEERKRLAKKKRSKVIMYQSVAKFIQLSIDFTDCWFYRKGLCKRGDTCPYKHGR